MNDHETEQFSANMHLAIFIDEVLPKVLPAIRADERFSELRVKGADLTDAQASELIRHIIFSIMNSGAGGFLGAVAVAPFSQLSTLMSAAVDHHNPRLAEKIVHGIPSGAEDLGWSPREGKHLQMLAREYVNATRRIAPLIFKIEKDAAELVLQEAQQHGEA